MVRPIVGNHVSPFLTTESHGLDLPDHRVVFHSVRFFSPRALFFKLAEGSLLWRDHISHGAWFPSVSALERVGSLCNRPSLRPKYLFTGSYLAWQL